MTMDPSRIGRVAGVASAAGCATLAAVFAFAPFYANQSVRIATDGSRQATSGSGTLWSANPQAHLALIGIFVALGLVGVLSLVVGWGRRRPARLALGVLLALFTAIGLIGAASIGLLLLPVAALGWFTFVSARRIEGGAGASR
jgi:hypothetical protein